MRKCFLKTTILLRTDPLHWPDLRQDKSQNTVNTHSPPPFVVFKVASFINLRVYCQ